MQDFAHYLLWNPLILLFVESNFKFARHAPAGRRIPLRVALGRAASPLGLWADLHVNYFDSGTSALAIAIRAALGPLIDRGARPRVILPGYGCPSLLAATRWAGGEPEYFDLEPSLFAPNTARIASALRAADAVVVCVDAFGVDSLGGAVRELKSSERRFLVHDLAQSYEAFEKGWTAQAPFTIVSFGRAKPVSLTVGGALLSTAVLPHQVIEALPWRKLSAAELGLRAAVYNASLIPPVFAALAQIPALQIGVTKLQSIQHVARFDRSFSAFVCAAADSYRAERSALINTPSIMNGAGRLDFLRRRLLWRAPVLLGCESAAQEAATHLKDLGVSRLYEKTLPEFESGTADDAAHSLPNAYAVSRRLITLPTHGRLSAEDWRKIRTSIEATFRSDKNLNQTQ